MPRRPSPSRGAAPTSRTCGASIRRRWRLREAVERLTDRRVVAFISGNHVEPDVAVETFILDASL
jgi:hypothetical protein